MSCNQGKYVYQLGHIMFKFYQIQTILGHKKVCMDSKLFVYVTIRIVPIYVKITVKLIMTIKSIQKMVITCLL